MNLSIKCAPLWQRATIQAQRLLVIGVLALLLVLGFAGSLFHAAAQVGSRTAGHAAAPHGLLAQDPPPVVKGLGAGLMVHGATAQ